MEPTAQEHPEARPPSYAFQRRRKVMGRISLDEGGFDYRLTGEADRRVAWEDVAAISLPPPLPERPPNYAFEILTRSGEKLDGQSRPWDGQDPEEQYRNYDRFLRSFLAAAAAHPHIQFNSRGLAYAIAVPAFAVLATGMLALGALMVLNLTAPDSGSASDRLFPLFALLNGGILMLLLGLYIRSARRPIPDARSVPEHRFPKVDGPPGR